LNPLIWMDMSNLISNLFDSDKQLLFGNLRFKCGVQQQVACTEVDKIVKLTCPKVSVNLEGSPFRGFYLT